ncbi:hypothetical protein [Salinigranum sp. GCM10025319]|uniref:hypothetical protein n=1 Tax=Salinigranum sp. GCM10025319 TaxID=3252687 RepID=UPI0036224FC3
MPSDDPTDDAPDWDDVLDVLELVIGDGYEVTRFEASTPEPAPEKAFLLEVERPVDDREHADDERDDDG